MDTFIQNRKIILLIVFAFIVHALILKAAFDIYFSSPIDHGMTPIKASNHPPAKRLVFMVADGLRAEAIFGEGQENTAPNLNKIRETRGSWGIAHTRVPTESRPGHVALLGGIYEDPAAILRGWKANPVDFDSVINQSTNAWCWGGPSIINMFNKDNLPHIHLHSYDAKMEDFGTKDTLALDLWVFDQVKTFIEQQTNCSNCVAFKQSGNLFFLHLLGIDTAGHGYKPESVEYKNNIKFVDDYIPRIEELFETAFPDNSTAYIFTADHGMTNWGSHGAGSDHETETPLIAWGSGIKVDQKQKDINQIDVAPLISALIGINIPINSLGKLPYVYIEASKTHLMEMINANIFQLMEIFNVKRVRRENNVFNFVPFKGVDTDGLNAKISYLNRLTFLRDFETFKVVAKNFMQFLIQGADYYHNYYQLPLLISITIGIIAWIIYLATYNIDILGNVEPTSFHFVIFGPAYAHVSFLLIIQSLPLMYYFYFLFPIFMIQVLVKRHLHIIEALKCIKNYGIMKAVNTIAAFGVGLALLVQGFRNREALSIAMCLMAVSIWFSEVLVLYTGIKQRLSWFASCICLAVFPLLPEMKTTFSLAYYITGYAVWWLLNDRIIVKLTENPLYSVSSLKVIKVQHLMFKAAILYTLAVEYELVAINSYLKHVAWAWAFYPVILIFRTSPHIFLRLTSIFSGFSTYYLMVTFNYEVLFLINYVLVLYCWLILETQCFQSTIHVNTIQRSTYNGEIVVYNVQTIGDFRRGFYFITLIFMGFFGTGNIASLNSFDPMWVRCFLTVFSPFKMTGLILLRIIIPFILASCVFRGINIFRRSGTPKVFCIVLMFSDLMLLELLYDITNIGSWLEIGMSLSQFIIMEAFVLILLVLYGFAYLLTASSFGPPFSVIFNFFQKIENLICFWVFTCFITIAYELVYSD